MWRPPDYRYRLKSGLTVNLSHPPTTEFAPNAWRPATDDEIKEAQAQLPETPEEIEQPARRRIPQPPPMRRKDRTKARAGRAGWLARWRCELEWHRCWQAEDSDSFFAGGWRQRLNQAAFRWIFLFRSTHREPTDTDAAATLAEDEELMAMQCGLPLRHLKMFATELALAPYTAALGKNRRRRQVVWSRQTLAARLNAPPEWKERLMQPTGPKKTRAATELSAKLVRLAALVSILAEPGGCELSLRQVQAALADRGVKVSLMTISKDLQAVKR